MAIERIVPGTNEWDAFYENHINRYQFASSKIDSKLELKILDAACGVGYGSYFLSKVENSSIFSIDRSDYAIDIAKNNFKSENIHYLVDDCHTLAKSSLFGPFDYIVSFETLEHLPFPTEFLNKCYDNLSVGGKLIISTPNKQISLKENLIKWEFHEQEYTPKEFSTLLYDTGFTNIQLYGQYLTPIGKLRKDIRAEINTILSNPFIRFGQWIQKYFRGSNFKLPLLEQSEDFEIVKLDISENDNREPFVLLAVCEKL